MTTNVCFHGVGVPQRELEPGEAPYWISVELFHRVLDEAAERPDVVLSFDDGNASDVIHGLPALTERGLSATFFALAGRLDQPGSLSVADLRQLMAAGMSVGSHGMDHVPWRGLDEAAQQRELVTARERLATAAGRAVDTAALPLGRYDRQLLGRLQRLGYRRVFSSDRLPTRAESWFQPRFSIRAADTVDTVRDILGPQPALPNLVQRGKVILKRLR